VINYFTVFPAGKAHHKAASRGVTKHDNLLIGLSGRFDQIRQIILKLVDVINVTASMWSHAVSTQIWDHDICSRRQFFGQPVKLHPMPARTVPHDQQRLIDTSCTIPVPPMVFPSRIVTG
jgi:hypothetical protein